jgi:hypothetical protein
LEISPSLSIIEAFNLYSSYGYSDEVATSSNDIFEYSEFATHHFSKHYNSLGFGAVLIIGHERILKRFRLKLNYTFELYELPAEYYYLEARQGTNYLNTYVKYQGRLSYLSFDLIYYVWKHKHKAKADE